jgi:hypothetical protein
MMRVRKGYDELLPGQARAKEHGGRLRITQGPEADRLNSWVALTVEACERLGMITVLEDAPEPWERLRDALRVAALEKTPDDQHPAHRVPSDVLRRAAELLGITEGE